MTSENTTTTIINAAQEITEQLSDITGLDTFICIASGDISSQSPICHTIGTCSKVQSLLAEALYLTTCSHPESPMDKIEFIAIIIALFKRADFVPQDITAILSYIGSRLLEEKDVTTPTIN